MIPVAILGAVVLSLLIAAVRRPALARIALRQAVRRPSQCFIVVAGLMLGGVAVTASLLAVDSAQRLTTQIEQLRWGTTDVTVAAARPFPIEIADLIAGDLDVKPYTRGVVPELSLGATLSDVSSRRTEAQATLLGVDPQRDATLGAFELLNGSRTTAIAARSIILNERAARQLGAGPGDTVSVMVQATGERISLPVRAVARMRGKAAWDFAPIAFVRLDVAQSLAHAPDSVNLLRVVAPGDPNATVAALNASLGRIGLPLRARAAKRDGLADAAAQTRFLRYALIAMSAFLVIAGILLIVNLVVILAEERAQHLGMLRALGMRRGALVLIGAIEGGGYSLAAGAIGAGLGFMLGALLTHILQSAFQRFFLPGGTPLPFLHHAGAGTILAGFGGGSLLALATMTAAWRRASRLNVPAAMRGLPLGLAARLRKPSGALVALRVGGVVLIGAALASSSGAMKGFAAVVAAAIGVSLARRSLSERARLSILSIAIVGWVLVTATTAEHGDARAFMQLFVMLNVVLVFALSLLFAANTPTLERGAALLGRWSAGARQTLRPVLAYLAQRPLRTGLTVGVFGIVLSLVTAAATVLAADRPRYEEDTSGFQVVATTMGTDAVDLRASPDIAAWRSVPFKIYRGAVSIPKRRIPQLTMNVYQATPTLTDLPLAERDPGFRSDKKAWQAVLGGDRAIGAIGPPGSPMEFENGTTTVTNAGSVRAGRLLLGAIVGPDQFAVLPGEIGVTYLIRAKPGVDPAGLVRSIEKQWFSDGLDASTARSLVDRGREDLRAFFAIIEFMTRLALGVGILALGIIGLRAAVERRQMIGTLRALGYRRRTVGMALLAEAAIVTTAGTVIGAGGGLLLNRMFLGKGAPGIALGSLGSTVAVTYIAALLVAAIPAVRASRIPPADAMRSAD